MKGDCLEVSAHTPMYNPHNLPLNKTNYTIIFVNIEWLKRNDFTSIFYINPNIIYVNTKYIRYLGILSKCVITVYSFLFITCWSPCLRCESLLRHWRHDAYWLEANISDSDQFYKTVLVGGQHFRFGPMLQNSIGWRPTRANYKTIYWLEAN